MTEIENQLLPGEAKFRLSDEGFLELSVSGGEWQMVTPMRLLPYASPENYISILKEEEEVGLIEALDAFSKDQQEILNKALDRRYFAPQVKSVKSAKEKMGFLYLDLLTSAGPRQVCVTDISTNLRAMPDGRVAILDVDGNRFFIRDLADLPRHERNRILLYL